MKIELVSERVWPRLRAAARATRGPSDVAVAYFGKTGSTQLPLRRGSNLVVNASEQAVRSGQTCPAALMPLLKRGVNVFTIGNLHSKVYVLGRQVFVGSANVSRHSEDDLVETMLTTTDREVVRGARAFVRGLRKQPLTPELLKELQKIYRPPKFEGAKRAARTSRQGVALMPRLHIAQLKRLTWSASEAAIHERALKTAVKRREHRRAWHLDSFSWSGKCSFRRGDMLLQIVTEKDGRKLVSRPGSVVYLHPYRTTKGSGSFVFVEIQGAERRRSLEQILKKLPRGSRSALQRRGLVRDAALTNNLLSLWGGR